MATPLPERDLAAWEQDLQARLLGAADRQAVLGQVFCPRCDHRLEPMPSKWDAILAITFTEETTCHCPRCGFDVVVAYQEMAMPAGRDRVVKVDGKTIGRQHIPRPMREVDGLDGADIYI